MNLALYKAYDKNRGGELVKLEKRRSKIDGHGIFTDNKISCGNIFYTFPTTDISERPGSGSKDGIFYWINHSCEPNSFFFIDAKSSHLRALTEIEDNEEITCNYNLIYIDGVKINCSCGSKSCIGTLLIPNN